MTLAQQLPRHKGALSQAGLEGRALREHGDTLLQLISQALERSDLPTRLPQPLNRQQGELLKSLRKEVASIAECEKLPAEILIRKKELEALVFAHDPQLQGRLCGWRADVIGRPLLKALRHLRKEEMK